MFGALLIVADVYVDENDGSGVGVFWPKPFLF
jgi:hypothetical protein